MRNEYVPRFGHFFIYFCFIVLLFATPNGVNVIECPRFRIGTGLNTHSRSRGHLQNKNKVFTRKQRKRTLHPWPYFRLSPNFSCMPMKFIPIQCIFRFVTLYLLLVWVTLLWLFFHFFWGIFGHNRICLHRAHTLSHTYQQVGDRFCIKNTPKSGPVFYLDYYKPRKRSITTDCLLKM